MKDKIIITGTFCLIVLIATTGLKAQEIHDAAAAGDPLPRFGPSPGIFDLKWSRPVYVGDTISYSWSILDKRASKSRPEWGIVTYLAEAYNQDGKCVLSFHGRFFLGRLPKA